jgi:hypothetical protein
LATAKRTKALVAEDLPKVGVKCIADILGIGDVTFAELIKSGVVQRQQGEEGYDIRSVCRAVVGEYRRRAHGRGEYSDQRALSAARASEAKARARIITLRSEDLEQQRWPIERVRHFYENTFHVLLECLNGLGAAICSRLVITGHEECPAVYEQTQGVINDFRNYMDERLAEMQPLITQATIERRTLGPIGKPGNGHDDDAA